MSSDFDSERCDHLSLMRATPDHVRQAIRQNRYSGHTAGLCEGLLQCNLAILPASFAEDFEAFCNANPKTCPLLGKSDIGGKSIDRLGKSIDLRTDLPLYKIYEHGVLSRSEVDILSLWRDDFVAFAIGCSFTFERALLAAGIGMRHIEENVTVPMFRTNIPTVQAGPFGGPTVVSMRPIKAADVKAAHEICASYPHAHGEPLHVGDPSKIGIADINTPDWGQAVSINEGELPVFWGCGVTSQAAIESAHPEICITHAPGAMLITDINELSNSDWRTAEPLEQSHP